MIKKLITTKIMCYEKIYFNEKGEKCPPISLIISVLTIMLVIFLSAGNAFSQSGEKYSVSGNSLNTGDVIGSKNAVDMVFITNNTKRMWLTKNGNLGIGKSKPFYKFEVAGRSRFIGNMYVDSVMFALSIEAAVLAKTASLLVMQNAVVNGTVTIGNALTLNGQSSSITSATGTITFLNNNIITTGNIKANLLTVNGLTDGTNTTNVSELRGHIDNTVIHFPVDDNSISTSNLWSASKINNELTQAANHDTVVATAVKTNSIFSNSNLYIQSDAGHGNTFFNAANNNKVCIGTGILQPVRLLVAGMNDSTASVAIGRTSDDSKGPQLALAKARGTVSNPLAIQSGDELGKIIYRGYDGTKYAQSDVFRALATENFSTTGCGSRLEFRTTPNGSTMPVNAMMLDHDQTATFSNTVFAPKLSIGVPIPQAPLDVQGDAIVRGWLYVQNGVVVGKKFQGGAAEVDTLRPAPQSPQQAVIIPSTVSEKIVSDTLRALEVNIKNALIIKALVEKITADTLVTEKMTLQELTADTVTGQKVEAAQMVTDTMYSSKVQTDKIETTQEVKVGTEIVIDGTTGKISASGLVSNNMTISGLLNLPNLIQDTTDTGKLLIADSYGNIKSLLSNPSNFLNLNSCIKAKAGCKIGINQPNPKDNMHIGNNLIFHDDNSRTFVGRNIYFDNGSYYSLFGGIVSSLLHLVRAVYLLRLTGT
ncbi:MAG: hypothetical protein HY738_10730 [Bacteroidia bacterium]|nr:hypothetical protein [Bacteroidia bacterium]